MEFIMAWTETTHANYRRSGEGYASNLTDAEWELMAPLLPPPARCGRRPATSRRAVLDALLYMVRTGCPWRGLPRDFPPRSTVQRYFYRWWGQVPGTAQRRADEAAAVRRRAAGRATGGGDRQPERQDDGERRPRGFDAAKRIKGRKGHIVTDTSGRLLAVHVHPANIQDIRQSRLIDRSTQISREAPRPDQP
jgi:putative transposase